MKTNTPVAHTLPQRKLGNNLIVSAIGYGAMGLSEFYGPSDEENSRKILHEVIDHGVTMIDSADVYGRGHNEELIGSVLATRKAEVSAGQIKIATKCGIERPKDAAYARGINNTPSYIRASCEASLKRLGLEQIDLYYIHRLDPSADIAETMSCMKELIKEGKIAHVGLCEVSALTLQKANEIQQITALQSEYSLWSRGVEAEILPMARKLGIGFVAYSPLGRGFLTGEITQTDTLADNDFRKHNPRFQQENLTHNLSFLESIKTIAERHEMTSAQVALTWLLAQDPSIVPIPGTRRIAFLEQNLASLKFKLSIRELSELDNAISINKIWGERYSEEGMKGVNV